MYHCTIMYIQRHTKPADSKSRQKKPASANQKRERTAFALFVAFSPGFAQIVVISSNHNSAGFICRPLFTIEYAIQ